MTAQEKGKEISALLQEAAACDTEAGRRAAAEEIRLDTLFKWVRYGLSISLTVLLLAGFALLYVKPGDAAYYVCLMTLVFDAVALAVIFTAAVRGRAKYKAVCTPAPGGKAAE